jgi:hypothetical protein
MVKIKHTLEFETELDETHSVAKRLLSLPLEMQSSFLSEMLKDLIVPELNPILNKINQGNSWAKLVVSE